MPFEWRYSIGLGAGRRPAGLRAQDEGIEGEPVPLRERLVVLVRVPGVEEHDLARLEGAVLRFPVLHHLGRDDRALSVRRLVEDAADVDDAAGPIHCAGEILSQVILPIGPANGIAAALGRDEVRGAIRLGARVLVDHVALAVVGEHALGQIVAVRAGHRLEPVEGPPLERRMGGPVRRQLLGDEHREVDDLGVAHRVGDLVADGLRAGRPLPPGPGGRPRRTASQSSDRLVRDFACMACPPVVRDRLEARSVSLARRGATLGA